jgi:integrase
MWPGPLVFYSEEGHPWVRTAARIPNDASRKYTTVNTITSMFSRRLKKTKINTLNGTGFYTLCRTAATPAIRSGCLFAIQMPLGHINLGMTTRYAQDVSL